MALFLALTGILLIAGGFLGLITMPGIAGIQAGIVFIAGVILFSAGALADRISSVIRRLREVREAVDRITELAHAPDPSPGLKPPQGDPTTSVIGSPIVPLKADRS